MFKNFEQLFCAKSFSFDVEDNHETIVHNCNDSIKALKSLAIKIRESLQSNESFNQLTEDDKHIIFTACTNTFTVRLHDDPHVINVQSDEICESIIHSAFQIMENFKS